MTWKSTAALVFAILLIAVAAGLVHDSRVATDFPSIRAKSSEADVLHLMGKPKQVHSSCAAYDTTVLPNCDHVFIYRSIFYPLRGKYWLVFFDKNEQVTATSSELEP
jgi:hypothetical protein